MTVPHPDPPIGGVYDKNAPMLDSRIRKREPIRLTALVGTDGTLTDHTFIECHIHGPAVVATVNCRFEQNILGSDPNAFLWPVDTQARPVAAGVVVLLNCLFERCVFVNVGFAGPAADIERW